MTPPAPKRRRTIVLDLPGVLILLLFPAFGLIAIVVAWGLWTGKLNPTTVVGVLSTMFSGLVLGAIAAARSGKDDEPDPGGEL